MLKKDMKRKIPTPYNKPLQERILFKFKRDFKRGDIIHRKMVQDKLEISFITTKKLFIYLYENDKLIGVRPTLKSITIGFPILEFKLK